MGNQRYIMVENIEHDLYSKDEILEFYEEGIKMWENDSLRDSLKGYEYGDMRVIKENRKKIVYEDLFNERFIVLRKKKNLNVMNFFDFGESKVDKKKFEKIIKKIPSELFMSCGKIVFLSSEKEIEKAMKKYEVTGDTSKRFRKDLIGVNITRNNVALINLVKIREEINFMEKEFGFIVRVNKDYEFCIAIIETIIHEIRHQMQNNIVFEEIFEEIDHEEDAESFAKEMTSLIASNEDMFFCKH